VDGGEGGDGHGGLKRLDTNYELMNHCKINHGLVEYRSAEDVVLGRPSAHDQREGTEEVGRSRPWRSRWERYNGFYRWYLTVALAMRYSGLVRPNAPPTEKPYS
jgi:hypothetical protein